MTEITIDIPAGLRPRTDRPAPPPLVAPPVAASPLPVAAPKPIERRPLAGIVAMICRKHGVTEAMMRGNGKDRRLSAARAEYAAVTQACGYSFPEAAREIDKDHSTLVLAARRWRNGQGATM